jgi:uncharacterized repeat protein (TIGR01451 family)
MGWIPMTASPRVCSSFVSLRHAFSSLAIALLLIAGSVSADTTPHNLASSNFSQNWSNTGQITANDSWTGVPSITGYLGDRAATGTTTDIDPQTVLDPLTTIDVIANQTNPNTNTAGGVAEFHTTLQAVPENTNPVVALQGSGTADHPNIIIYLDTTGRSAINVSYLLRDIDCAADNATQQMALQYRVGSSGNYTNLPAGYFGDVGTGASVCTATQAVSVVLPAGADNQAVVEVRIITSNAGGSDEWIGIDDIVVSSAALGNAGIVPTCPAALNTNQGTATSGGVSATDADGTVTSASITGITPSNPGTITLTGFTPAGGVGGTANATLNVSAATPAGSYSVTIQWTNNDGSPQTANCVVAVNVTAPPSVVFIHQVQGSGAATGMAAATVTVEGIVTGDFQPIANDVRLSGFFLQEETTDEDGLAATSEGIFIFCSTCPTDVAEGQKVQVTGTVSEFFNSTQITATTAGSVVITNAGNNLALVTTATIDLPIVAPNVDDFYEPMESMRVNYVDTLTVSEYFEQARYGRIELFQGGRPRQYTEVNPPSAPGYAAQLDNLNRRRVYLDDDDNVENSPLLLPDGSQFVFHPRANGGLSVGTQGADFFRGGDQITSLTGILHWSFSGGPSPNEWRVRPTAANPATFTAVNPRPAAPPTIGGAIRVASANVLNYFTTLNVRGADSVAELNRQRARTAAVLCALDADVAALMEIENGNAAITDLLGAVNTQCGGTQPYAFVNTGGALGTDQIRVMLIYRTNVVAPVGSPLTDSDSVHNRPPTAQTFDVVDTGNPAYGKRFTALANHSKSKGGCPASGPDADQNDGQGCFAATRVAQHNRILTWLNDIVIPAAGDPDVVLLGDFNSYAQEPPTTTLTSGGYTDLESAFLGASAYSYLFDGQLGHIDYAFASSSLLPQVASVNVWHINADENPLFDYNDEIDDGSAEAAFEEKPDGSALTPPRVLFQAGTYRASDHDPVLLGLFQIADLQITKTDSPDPVNAGTNLTYTITVTNHGPDAAPTTSWSDTLPGGTLFVSVSTGASGWTCSNPPTGTHGTVSCSNPSFGVGNAAFTLTIAVPPDVANGTVLSNTATIMSAAAEGNPGQESATETTTVSTSADVTVAKSDSPDPVNAGDNITYTIDVTNAGPSWAVNGQLTDTVPAGTTFVSLSSPGWTCTQPSTGGTGNITCDASVVGFGANTFTLVVKVNPSTAAGTVITNSATFTSTTSDPNSGGETGTATTTVTASADVSVTKTDSPDPVTAGNDLTYTITVNNAGPSNAATVTLTDNLPAATTFVSLSSPGGWTCAPLTVGAGGTLSCTNLNMGIGSAVFTLVVKVNPGALTGNDVITNTATVSSTTSDPNTGNETGGAVTSVNAAADLAVTKVDTPDPVTAGNNLTYTINLVNNGPSNASGVDVTDAIPANTTFVSATVTTGSGWLTSAPAVGGTGNVVFGKATVTPGETAVFTIVVNVNAATPNDTVITNSAVVTSISDDPNSGNDVGTATTTVGVGSADISVTKTDSTDPVMAGASITYTITVNNAGPSNATTTTLSDVVPAGTTFSSLSAPAGWSCTTPAVGGTGTVTCTNTSMAIGDAVFSLTVAVNPSATPNSVITNTATASSATTDPVGGNQSATATTTVISPATLSATKTASGSFASGSVITYSIVITNSGPSTQANNPGNELIDVLPSQLTLISATANSGSAVATVATNTVTWNGSIAAGGTVTITIQALIEPDVPVGSTITNQATINYDADGNGTNESTTVTDDPSQPGSANGTAIIVGPPAAANVAIPALDGLGLAALAALLAGLGLLLMRRS